MKKLVSRNPIERFKQVVKAENGVSLINSKAQNDVPLINFKAGKVQKGWKEEDQYKQTLNALTLQQKDWLDSQNINYTNAATMQAGMNNYLALNGNTDHGLSQDGHWGTQSDRTLKAILAQMPANYKIKDTKPINAPVVTTPNFGYRSTFNYADGSRDFGFNNYNGLVAFASTFKDDAFARDLRERFGEDPSKWNQKQVEAALNVRGKYRGGAGGDINDMLRSMAAWAGDNNRTWDNNYIRQQAASQKVVPPIDDAAEFYKWAQTQPELMAKYRASKNPN